MITKLISMLLLLVLCLGLLPGFGSVAAQEDSTFIDIAMQGNVELEEIQVALSEVVQPEVSAAPEAAAQPEISAAPETAAQPEVSAVPEIAVQTEAPAPAPYVMKEAEASGIWQKKNGKAVIDYSNIADGYVMVNYTEATTKRLKVQVKGPTTTYTYNLNVGEWTVFPLSEGNGTYQIKVYRNTTGNKYTLCLSLSERVRLNDQFAPFIRPNQYVNYSKDSKAVAKARDLTKNLSDPLDKVSAVYNYVVDNLTYDKKKASTVKSGYLPDLDAVLAAKKGICFDYAALMTGMLRSQGIPCKLVVGYAGTAYHAWINVWTEETGWIDNAIYFDGTCWNRMDPTYASSSNRSEKIMKYIGDGANYTTKYLY